MLDQVARRHIRPDQDEVVRIGIEHCAGAGLVEIKFEIIAYDLEGINGVVAAVDENSVLRRGVPDEILAPSELSEHLATQAPLLHEAQRRPALRATRPHPTC